jgi:hypothetical protein
MHKEASAGERGASAATMSCRNIAPATFQQLFHHQGQAYLEKGLCYQEELY